MENTVVGPNSLSDLLIDPDPFRLRSIPAGLGSPVELAALGELPTRGELGLIHVNKDKAVDSEFCVAEMVLAMLCKTPRLAPGSGLEPEYRAPKARVLPLDDPAAPA